MHVLPAVAWLAAAASAASPPFSPPAGHFTSEGVTQAARPSCSGRYAPVKPGVEPGVVLCPGYQPHPRGSLPVVLGHRIRFTVRGARDVRMVLTAPFLTKPQFARIVWRLRTHRVAGSTTRWEARVPSRMKVTPNAVIASAEFSGRGHSDYVLGVRVRR
jgi:hypothetical protein